MKTSEAIRHAVEFIEYADNYSTKDVEVREHLRTFVTRWEATIDVLGESEPGKVLNDLIGYLLKTGASL